MSDIWNGAGTWKGWHLTTDHAASSYNQPVLVMPDGTPLGPGDIIVGPLVGYAETAEILGWDKRRVGLYMSRGAFPQPIQHLASGPIWTRKQIEDYRDSRN